MGVADIATVLAWLEGEVGSTDLGPHVDLEVMGLIGHSAGGSSTTSVGELDDRFDVLVPMAGGGAVGGCEIGLCVIRRHEDIGRRASKHTGQPLRGRHLEGQPCLELRPEARQIGEVE